MAAPNVRLLGRCSDAEATGWLERCWQGHRAWLDQQRQPVPLA
jgi:hypothetical protein